MGIYIMEIKKAISIMKVLVLIAGILFLFIYTSYETSDCGMCSFNSGNIDSFMNDYSSQCLRTLKDTPNITNYNPTNAYSEQPI